VGFAADRRRRGEGELVTTNGALQKGDRVQLTDEAREMFPGRSRPCVGTAVGYSKDGAGVWLVWDRAASRTRHKYSRRFLERVEDRLRCSDCRLPYSEFPLDTTLPDEQWLRINEGNPGGVLCAACIVRRASRLPGAAAVRARIAFGGDPEQNLHND
jgi:hypothetical protein